ncbi:hypothetical protein J421_1091 [Gemmatirosa kalamazoonensis]|uniref:Uncharacterized protein n=2 Tax=Gemmatirosa kalamazoonensis TaxID=861299 RepID=W0RGV2_9BACT|nr:hypothetical protein J421_1091 [Gemmatirosa kalamazoonensis]
MLAGAACAWAGMGACVGAERGAAARVPVRPDSASAAWDSLLALDGPPHAIFGCLTGDSAVYGDVRPDPETGDTIGVWLTFYRAGGGVDGMRVLGGIDRADTATFLRVQLSGGDSLAFDVPAVPLDRFREGIDTARFIGRVACDRLWGRQREHRDQPSRTVVYRRVVQPVTDEPVP